jgi:hypothetical protein
MYVEFSRDARGFARLDFIDVDGRPCRIKQDVADAIVLLDRDGNRITVDRDHVASLLPIFSGFVATGKL